ncbi:hypothetical protein DYD21_08495 [Rhodohalobacter sp. SW132]|nr:hypothetical protein DYD21_08495 [Rhodohalobacter sp. SW132]
MVCYSVWVSGRAPEINGLILKLQNKRAFNHKWFNSPTLWVGKDEVPLPPKGCPRQKGALQNKLHIDQKGMGPNLIPSGLCPEVVYL